MNMDEAIQATFPLIAAPTQGSIPPASASGTRYLVASDGVWRELTLPWVRFRHQLAAAAMRLPYGELEPMIEIRCGGIPPELIREFVADAREACPNEVAGVFLWHEPSDSWRYERRESMSASGSHIDYQEVRPLDDEHIVVDVHSHGRHPAFFSSEDNADDAGSMKFSLVLGNLDQAQPTSEMRLCMAGVVVNNATLGPDGALGVS